MNILFICGCQEPGKDGVGDYTLILAHELLKSGIKVAVLSYNDVYINNFIKEENRELQILRLGKNLSSRKRKDLAKAFINTNKPEFISLQFVPYAYHPKGLPWNLGYELSILGKNIPWHIMFHELWIEGKDLKSRLIAHLQEKIIKRLIHHLDPALVHTSIPIYQSRLENLGIDAMPLPIFSNIKLNRNQSLQVTKTFNITFFSQLTLRASILEFLIVLIDELKNKQINFKILIIGGSKQAKLELESFFNNVPDIFNNLEQVEFLPADELSQRIKTSNLGITPVPRHLLGKSGSVATFLSHGVPIAAPYIKSGYHCENSGFFSTKVANSIVTIPSLDKIETATLITREIANTVTASSIVEMFKNDLELISSIQEINLNMIT